MSLANYIDHTLLKPDTTLTDIEKLCQEASHFQFASVCLPPFYVREAVQFLKNTQVKIATVIGFPMGYSATPAKVEEIKRALDDGADELDVVINICALKSGNWNYLENDIESMTRAVHLKGKTIKVIIETPLLSRDELVRTCRLCEDSAVNFVKTCTGVHGGVNVEIIRTLRELLPDSIGIKASGGIRTVNDANELISAGADRIGTSAGLQMV